MSKITNDGLTWSAWHRMLYSCTHMATVGVRFKCYESEELHCGCMCFSVHS